MALTFIGWSSWEVKLALFEQLGAPPPAPRQPRGSATQQQVGPPIARTCPESLEPSRAHTRQTSFKP